VFLAGDINHGDGAEHPPGFVGHHFMLAQPLTRHTAEIGDRVGHRIFGLAVRFPASLRGATIADDLARLIKILTQHWVYYDV
jgi:hypothetical protein